MTGELTHTVSEKALRPSYINYRLKSEVSIMPLSAMLNPLHSISNQKLFKKHLYNPCIPKERNHAAPPNHIELL